MQNASISIDAEQIVCERRFDLTPYLTFKLIGAKYAMSIMPAGGRTGVYAIDPIISCVKWQPLRLTLRGDLIYFVCRLSGYGEGEREEKKCGR